MIWLSLLHSGNHTSGNWPGYYIAFVYIVWPVLVPLGILLLEKQIIRRLMIMVILLGGVNHAVLAQSYILPFHIIARIINACIAYGYVYPPHDAVFPYEVVTCGAFFCSSNRMIILLGCIFVFAYLITDYFYSYAATSVWCFFSALISGLIYWYFRRRDRGNV